MEDLISIQKYAATHRQSIHTVIKKTMNGELKTVVKVENGKEVTYIVPSSSQPIHEAVESISSDEIEIDYKKEYDALHKKYLMLKTKYEKLLDN